MSAGMQTQPLDYLPPKLLDLSYIRSQLTRLEDTILFHLIERSQYPLCAPIYHSAEGEYRLPLLDHLLHAQELVHARFRRYEAMDEVPFFPDVAREQSVLPRTDNQYDPAIVRKSRLPFHWDAINYSQKIRREYAERIMPSACCYAGRAASPSVSEEGETVEEGQVMGSAALCDVSVLQALSRRIHFGKFVAEAKFRAERPRFEALIRARDADGIERAITNEAVEKKILERMAVKAMVYGADPSADYAGGRLDVEGVVRMYKDWVIPLTKEVEIDYLLQRLDGEPAFVQMV